jgi:hypothetical protein
MVRDITNTIIMMTTDTRSIILMGIEDLIEVEVGEEEEVTITIIKMNIKNRIKQYRVNQVNSRRV